MSSTNHRRPTSRFSEGAVFASGVVVIVAITVAAVFVIHRQLQPQRPAHLFALIPPASVANQAPAATGAFVAPSHFVVYANRHQCGHPVRVERRHHHGWQQRFSRCLLREAGVYRVKNVAPKPPTLPTLTPQPTNVVLPTVPPPTIARPTATVVPINVPDYRSQCSSGSTLGCEEYLVSLMNAERAQYAEGPLTLSPTLSNGSGTCIGAIGHAQHMASIDTIAHDQFPADVCGPYATAGENVGVAGYGSPLGDVDAIHTQMKNEPFTPGCSGNHHCNWMSPSFRQVGIGIAAGTYSGFSADYESEEYTN